VTELKKQLKELGIKVNCYDSKSFTCQVVFPENKWFDHPDSAYKFLETWLESLNTNYISKEEVKDFLDDTEICAGDGYCEINSDDIRKRFDLNNI